MNTTQRQCPGVRVTIRGLTSVASIQMASKQPYFIQLCKPSPFEEEHLWTPSTSAALAPGNRFCLLLGCYALLILIGPASEKIGGPREDS